MSVSLKNSVVPTFGRHETFTLRYSWLKRGYDAVAEPDLAQKVTAFYDKTYYIFNDPDAHHILGVGKNMARSIRFWLQACRVVEEVKVAGSRAPRGRATVFGEGLLATDGGLDPYLEHAETWWILHWMIVSPGSYLPVWWTAFHSFPAVAFTTEQLLEHVHAQVEATAAWHTPRSPNPGTIRKDMLALLRCYAGTAGSRKRDLIDDQLDAPFVPLTLVRTTTDDRSFRFGVGPKPGLAPAVAAFSCLDFLARSGSTARQILIGSLAVEQGGPGRAFKLTERDLAELLEKAAADTPDLLQITSAAGSDALAILGSEPLDLVAAQVLHRHYVSLGSHADEPVAPYVPWAPGSDLGQTYVATSAEEGSA